MSLTVLRRHRESTSATGRCADLQPVDVIAGESEGCLSIADVRWREHVRLLGRVRSLRVEPWSDLPTLECTLVDDSGGITVVFLGRRNVPGIRLGTRMIVEGAAGAHHGRLAILNPEYTLLPNEVSP